MLAHSDEPACGVVDYPGNIEQLKYLGGQFRNGYSLADSREA
jgi:hypothetical protein